MAPVNVKCNLCGGDDYKMVFESTAGDISPTVAECTSTVSGYASSNRIVRCNKCGFIYANPRDEGLTNLYEQVVDNDYLESWEERAHTFRGHLKALGRVTDGEVKARLLRRTTGRQHTPRNDGRSDDRPAMTESTGELLDIGCYAGVFLEEAKKAGYNITGIEPSKWAAGYAANRTGAKVLQGSWDKALLPENHFDVVTIWDVIEHVDDPSACLGQVCRWLKPGGIVAIATHDIGSFFARVMGRRYPWLMRFHLHHFTPKTLSEMLSRNGLEPVLVKYYVKSFSLKYIMGRLGRENRNSPHLGRAAARGQSPFSHMLFEKISIPLPSGDMFMVVARKG